MNREQFELEKDIVGWLMQNGFTFLQATSVMAYHYKSDKPISDCLYILQDKFFDKENQIKIRERL